jgi:hypothetical protein
VPRSIYLGHVVSWLFVGIVLFLGRRVGAIPFPDATLVVFAAIYFLGALWIIRQRHGDKGFFVRLASVALIGSWAVAMGHFLMPDSYPYTFGSRPGWYVLMIDIIFTTYAVCPPVFLLLGLILSSSASPADPDIDLSHNS